MAWVSPPMMAVPSLIAEYACSGPSTMDGGVLANTFLNLVTIVIALYVTQVTRRVDKEVRNGGE